MDQKGDTEDGEVIQEEKEEEIKSEEFKPLFSKKYFMNSKVDEVVFCGDSLERILVLTENGKAYHTKNFGRNWTLTSNTFDSYHTSMDMNVITLLQNPNKVDQIIFVDKNLENMVTNDCGDTFKPLYDR